MTKKPGNTCYVLICAVLTIQLAGCMMAPARREQRVSQAGPGYNINVNIGNAPEQIILAEPPVFIAPPALGFYTAVGIPYDIFLVDSNYYINRNGAWYIGSGYNGPWAAVQYAQLPRGLRQQKYEQIIRIRDEEYRIYEQDQDNYRGKLYRPEKHEKRQAYNVNNR